MIEDAASKERQAPARLFYHATWTESLPSIMEHGLDPAFTGQNFKCEAGVYLAGSPQEASMMLLDAKSRSTIGPHDFWKPLEDMRIIVIDAGRIEPALLKADPKAHSTISSWRYEGKIQVRGCRVGPAT